eukprot:5892258-Pyramimonas_sp.AAC.1
MDINGYQWTSTDINGHHHQWTSMDINGHQWTSMLSLQTMDRRWIEAYLGGPCGESGREARRGSPPEGEVALLGGHGCHGEHAKPAGHLLDGLAAVELVVPHLGGQLAHRGVLEEVRGGEHARALLGDELAHLDEEERVC